MGTGLTGLLAFLLAVFLTPFVLRGDIKATDIQAALDAPPGVVFSAPGNYSGSNSAWTVNTGAIPKVPANIDGKVSWVGKSCLIGAVPSAKGYEDYWNLRSRNYFTVTVKGAGTLTFRYRTSLDDYKDAKLVAYLYDGNNAKALQADGYDDPDDETEATVLPFELLFEDSGYWSEYAEKWGEMYYDLAADEFWQTATVTLDAEAYTHVVTIAVVGSAKYDSNGDSFGSYVLDEEYDGFVQENRVYLDAMTWTPDEGLETVRLSEESGTEFTGAMEVFVDSDYDLEAFDFYYTTDGKQPSLQSPCISYRELLAADDEEEESDDNDEEESDDDGDEGDDDDNGGIVVIDDCMVWVRAYETKTATWVGEAKASYHRVAPLPEVAVVPMEDFSDRTTLVFNAPSDSEMSYYYTLDGSTPTTKSPKADDDRITLSNSKLVGKNLKVIALEEGKYVSPVVSCQLERLASPLLSWSVDGVESQETCFVNSVLVNAIVPDDAEVLLNPVSGLLTETGVVQAVALAEGRLASLPVIQSFARLDMQLATSAEGLFGAGAKDTWAFFTLPGEMSSADQRTLTEYLHPYAISGNSFIKPSSLQGGNTYLVWVPGVDFSAPPSMLRYASKAATPAAISGWHFVPSGAQWVWDEQLKGFSPAQDGSQPGWKDDK